MSSAWAAAAEPDAATRAAARKLAEDGVTALQNGDAATATQKLEKAHRTLQVPSVALWSARALAKQGLLVEARERYLEATRLTASGDQAVQEQARLDAGKEGDELKQRIPSLLISVTGAAPAEVKVTLDGQELPSLLLGEDRPTNPGRHQVVATRGAEQANADVTLAEGEHQRVELKLAAATGAAPLAVTSGPLAAPAPAPGNMRRTLGFVVLAAGGAGLVVGGVTGVLAISKRSALDEDVRCMEGECLYSAEDEVKSLRTFRTVSTVGLIAGGVLAAAGVTLVLTAPKASGDQARLSLQLGAQHVGLHGAF